MSPQIARNSPRTKVLNDPSSSDPDDVILATTSSVTKTETTSSRRLSDPASTTKQTRIETTTFKKARLLTWDGLPEWQRDNHYILSGYVPETNSYHGSFLSLAYLHNETVNIYTHLIPSVFIILLSASLILLGVFYSFEIVAKDLSYSVKESPPFVLSDTVAFLVFGFGASACLGLSATFHTLKSHSHAISTFGNQLDYLGIVVLIVASMISIINYAFIDMVAYRLFFWGLTLFLGTACSVVTLDSKFRTSEWRPFRAAMFVAFGLSGVFPVLTAFWLFGVQEAWDRSQLTYLLAEAVLYIGGAAIYAARIPERWNPGKYDFFGHSHQIFHCLVVLAAISHGLGVYYATQFAHKVTLPSYYSS